MSRCIECGCLMDDLSAEKWYYCRKCRKKLAKKFRKRGKRLARVPRCTDPIDPPAPEAERLYDGLRQLEVGETGVDLEDEE